MLLYLLKLNLKNVKSHIENKIFLIFVKFLLQVGFVM